MVKRLPDGTPEFFGLGNLLLPDVIFSRMEYGVSKEAAQKIPFEKLEAFMNGYYSELNSRNLIIRALIKLGDRFNPSPSFLAYEDVYKSRKIGDTYGQG